MIRREADSGPSRAPVEALPAGLERALGDPAAYPGDPSAGAGVTAVQTHISWVFLTGERVYKVRKAVDLGFLDFSTRAARNADCAREVALNRRLAPDVYLGVAPLLAADGGLRVGPPREALEPAAPPAPPSEHCVVMRRLPDGGDALSRLARGTLEPAHLDAVAERVAAFHAANGLGEPAPFAPVEWLERITGPVADNFRSLDGSLADAPGRAALERARAAAADFERERGARFEARRRAGRAVDGHGDLHLAHVWFEDESREPVIIDCIEFSEPLRRIDGASEVAFLAMDLAYRERSDLAERFLRRYARERDDFDLYGVVDYFVAYRAGVRAKVAALAAAEPEIPEPQRARAAESARRHLAFAAQALAPRRAGALVLVCGVVGAGKTTLAELAADALGGVVVSSDRVRKRLAGLAPTERPHAGFQAGIYTPERSKQVYAGLLERAGPIADSGRVAVLDATWAGAAQRAEALAWAGARGLPALLVEARCAREVALERLSRRRREGRDPSDAGPELYDRSRAGFEPPGEWPRARRLAVATDAPEWRDRAAAAVRELVAAATSEER